MGDDRKASLEFSFLLITLLVPAGYWILQWLVGELTI